MSVAAKKWVRKHSPTRGRARTVLAELAWAGDGNGRGARLSHRDLVKATGLSRATVQRALVELERDDQIRRHRGCSCEQCTRAARGVVVFDVVIPEQLDEIEHNPGQMTLLAGASDQPQDRPHDQHHLRPVAKDHQPHPEAGSSLRVRHLEEKRTELQQQQQGAREFSNELVATVERVVEALSPTRLFVDRLAIEAVVMHSTPAAVEAALIDVIALASDPAYRLPKGGAAKMLNGELRRQASRPASVFGQRSPCPAESAAPPELPDRFAKYNVAAGLAS